MQKEWNDMMSDAFAKRHPLVNFLFFIEVMGMSVMIQHPAYLLINIVCAGSYYLLLNGRKGWKMMKGFVLLFLFLTVINPLFNANGERELFSVFGRPYTVEALLYGAAIAAVFVGMVLWFGCYNKVLTSDKFTSLFANMIPSIALLLVMVLRMIPNLMHKAKQFTGARKVIGKGASDTAFARERIMDGMNVLSALTSWALEGSVITGDSMRSRGYGTAKRSSFMIYRITAIDISLLSIQVILSLLVLWSACLGQMTVNFTPQFSIAALSWGIVPYTFYLLIPIILNIKEMIQWYISKLKI